MFAMRKAAKNHKKDEAEKPFWISFSDLMTSLMVLFLVVMSVALLSITKTVSDVERAKAEREAEIKKILERVELMTRDFPGMRLRKNAIDFGERANFETDSHKLTDEQAVLLRTFIPKLLDLTRQDMAQKWLKQIVVEGYADERGSYLYNLHLSLQRSERVLCVLLAPPSSVEERSPWQPADLALAKELFLVGGYSSNSLKSSPEESRRIELKLEFFDVVEQQSGLNRPVVMPISAGTSFGACRL
jgi:outer membrane protein OmpA-like peptidoglycan-associated protein